MELLRSITVSSEEETAEFARSLADTIQSGDVVALNGNLGSGKTFIVKKYCEQAGIASASSPTFAIVNQYHANALIYHIDFYRIKKVEELYDIGIEEYFYDPRAVCFVEWAEMFPDVLPDRRFEITIELLNEYERKISLYTHG